LSGVPIGAVDKISLEPDYSTEVILAIKPGFEIPQNSRFLIQAPITGETTILIEPPADVTKDVATLPHEILPIDQQPRGANPVSFADLLEQGQGEVRRLDDLLAQFQKAEPLLLTELQATLRNTDTLTTNANASLSSITAKVETLTDSLQKNLTVASDNVVDLTGTLNSVVQHDSVKIDVLLAQVTHTSKSFSETVDSLHDIATNPKVKANLVNTTRDFAATAKALAELTSDLRNVTGNPQTQAELRDTVAQLDATSQKVDSLVGQLGGVSAVYGIDANASPAPAATAVPPGFVPTSQPVLPPSSAAPANPAGSTATPGGSPHVATPTNSAALANLRARLNSFTKDLVQLQVRVGQLSPARPGSLVTNTSPLLTKDRGPETDFNVFLLPKAHTGLEAGVNDVGSTGTSTANFMLFNRGNGFTYGGGLEYSRLGLTTSVDRGPVGVEARVYDLRHPTLDSYLNLFAFPKFQIFGGERDITHVDRRTVFGLQFEF
jgi:hypothetical protein